MNTKAIQEYLQSYCNRGYFPGAVCGIYFSNEEDFICTGHLEIGSGKPTTSPTTIFDLASLTKPVATTTAALQLIEKGILSLHDHISNYLDEFKTCNHGITLWHLMTHTSGLPAWIPLYIKVENPEDCINYIAHLKPQYMPGKYVEYSCLGYILLGEIIRRATGNNLAEFCQRNIFNPVGMKDTRFNPEKELLSRIAPTEMGNEYERSIAGQSAKRYKHWRRHRLHGEVQDGNSHFFRGEGGNAGLFSTVSDLLTFGKCILNNGKVNNVQLISREMIQLSTMNQTESLNSSRGLGWQMAVSSLSAGSGFSSNAFGHNGFSGTSIWIDPDYQLIVVLLTNRSFFGGDGKLFGKIRGPFHELLASSLGILKT